MKEGKIAKLGVGLAKINVDNETKKSRVLVRTDNSTVILNQALHAHINPSIQPDAKGNQKTVRFIGIAEGKPSPFTLNVGDEKEAVKLKDLLEEYKAKA